MPEKLRAGVIGCGVGSSHAYAYTRHPEVELVAVCDIDPAVFSKLYDRAEIARGTVREYTDYRQMLARERLDLLSVATPDPYHADPVVDAAAAGVPGILCEKPLASTLADADRMVAAVERHGTKLLVDHTRCFEPCYTEVRARIRAGYLGELTRIVTYGGGKRAMLFRNTTHLLGTVRFYAEAAPVWVIAALDRGFEDYGTEYKGEGGKDPALDPGATLIVEFANGVRALVNASKRTPGAGHEVDLLGTHGRIIAGDFGTRAWQCTTEEGRLEPREVTWAQGIGPSLGERLIPAVDQLIGMVRHDAPGNSTAHDGRDVLEIMLAALQSQASGMVPIRLPLPR